MLVQQGVEGVVDRFDPGRAEKKQMQFMVTRLLNLSEVPKPDDAADALAVAICHAHSVRLGALVKHGIRG